MMHFCKNCKHHAWLLTSYHGNVCAINEYEVMDPVTGKYMITLMRCKSKNHDCLCRDYVERTDRWYNLKNKIYRVYTKFLNVLNK